MSECSLVRYPRQRQQRCGCLEEQPVAMNTGDVVSAGHNHHHQSTTSRVYPVRVTPIISLHLIYHTAVLFAWLRMMARSE
ncbi:hypothetical protein E2C01_015318 [Portunus trituberculatus]|uniref:Uncharacterized protein n=1 Tax=Portunus trituberculatus TaxID=210409 RepID=A0A5B7DME5_PORTR|nr:hypothetical protein [Portunus trituberculatus]